VGAIAESTFGNKPSGRNYKERHYHKPWFDADYHTWKRELMLWLKTNPDSHATKHQENKLKILLLKKKLWETTRAQHMCAFAKMDVLLFWKKYRPRAPVVGKINVTELLGGFCGLIG